MIYFADTELLGLKIGDTDISAVYAGDLLIYPTTVTAWSVTPTVISAASSGGTEKIKIAALASWTISSNESWITFSQNSGDSGRTTVMATIGNNTSTSRTATITVTDGDQFTQAISVSQEGLAFSVSPTAITAQSGATAETITISSPYNWTIVSSENWITFSQDSGANGTYTVTASIASADTARSATITVSNGYSSSAISVEQKIKATLPSNTFLFNYNAKRYSSGVFTKEQGQLYNYDIRLLNAGNVTDMGDYVQFNNNAYETRHYTAAADNPFNRSSADSTFTFIYKTSGYSGQGNRKLFSNRQIQNSGQSKYDCHNYLIASDSVFGFSGSFGPSNNPQYMVIRAFSDNSGLQQEVDVNGNVIQSATTTSVGWDSPSAGIGFFTGGHNYTSSNECFRSGFYWMYCSNEALTDAEVLQVIKYNEEM